MDKCGSDDVGALRIFLRSKQVVLAEAFLVTRDFPDIKACNVLMNHYAAEGSVQKAVALLDFMIARGIEPTATTYATTCKAMAFHGQVKEVANLIKTLQDCRVDVEVNIYFYSALILACSNCRSPDVTTAERCFQEAALRGLPVQTLKKVLSKTVGATRSKELMSWALSLEPSKQLGKSLSQSLAAWGLPELGRGPQKHLLCRSKSGTLK
mmetsp:Transcript_31775/g.69463  ORF Transcript_31775/g.69463 Transcript_31775/m.69463 type:complete len:210 (+) Transcript_31775:53-682(+)